MEKPLDTKLYTRLAIFILAFRLETALLTRRVHLDAADAERSVRAVFSAYHTTPVLGSPMRPLDETWTSADIVQRTEPRGATSTPSTIRERGRICWDTDKVQLCMGMFSLSSSTIVRESNNTRA